MDLLNDMPRPASSSRADALLPSIAIVFSIIIILVAALSMVS